MRDLTSFLNLWAAETPDGIALSAGDLEISYAQLSGMVDDAASRFQAAGVTPGARVVIAGVNTPAWVVAFLATLRARGIVVPLNSRIGAGQVPGMLADIAPVLVVADHSQLPAFAAVADALADALVPVGAGDPSALTTLPAASEPFKPASVEPDTPALLSFTSGTTSAPKGALISHGSIMTAVRSWLPFSLPGPDSLTTVLVPLFHNTAYIDQIAQMLVAGGQIDLIPRYRTEVAVEAMRRRPPSLIVTVPSMLRMLMTHPAADEIFSACTTAGIGGSAMPSAWALELVTRWPDVSLMHGYGMTEFTSLSHVLSGTALVDHADSVGWPVHQARCEVRDPELTPLPPDVPGEVWLTGPQRMLGYWRNPDATAKAFEGDWLRTGDRGVLDSEGRLRILGRMDGVINRGGEMISPEMVEEALSHDPSLSTCAVFGLPDDLLGERVACAVVTHPGSIFDQGQARALLGDRIPDYAWPAEFHLMDQLPLSATGKVDRRAILAILRDREA